jgi:hypothetical protein
MAELPTTRWAQPQACAEDRMSDRELLDSRSLRSAVGKPLKAPLFRAFFDGVFRSLFCQLDEQETKPIL